MKHYMQCKSENIDDAVDQFAKLRSYRPFAYSGKWFVAKIAPKKWRTYRTKIAAMSNTIENQIYEIKL